MSVYGKLQVDTDLENSGVVRDYGQYRVTIARAGGANKHYEKTLEEVGKPFEVAAATGSMDNQLAVKIMQKVYVKSVIRNWEVKDEDGEWVQGLYDPRDGSVLEFSRENVERVLADQSLHDLWTDIQATATRGSLFAASIEDARAGN